MPELKFSGAIDENKADPEVLATGVSNNVKKNVVKILPTVEETKTVEVIVLNNTECSSSSSVRSLTETKLIHEQDTLRNSTVEAFEGNYIWNTPRRVNTFEIRPAMDGGLEYIWKGQKTALKHKLGKVDILECTSYEFWFDSKDYLIRKEKSGNGSQVKAKRERTLLNLEREVRQLKKYLCLYTTLLDFRVSPGYEANVYTKWYDWKTIKPPLKMQLVSFIYFLGGLFSGMFSHYFWLRKGVNLPNIFLSITPSALYLIVVAIVFIIPYFDKRECGTEGRSFFEEWSKHKQCREKIFLLGWLSLGMRVYYEVLLREGISFSNVGALCAFVHLFFKADLILRDYICKEENCEIPIHAVRDKIGKYLIDCEVGLPAECRRPLKKGEI